MMSHRNPSQEGNLTSLMRHHADLVKLLLLPLLAAPIILTRNRVKTKRQVKLPLCENGIDIPVVKVTSQEETVRIVSIIDLSP